ncbi:MAG: metal-sulfur cluster assembly factor [bacterium]|nr:metal-sulfur cluster assembly factor [bacterium]
MPTKKQVSDKLYNVIDPELNLSIIDLGLVYDIKVTKKKVHITMTLTSLGCPLFDTIKDDMLAQMEALDVKEDDVEIELTFDPPWSMDLMSESAKAMLGI